MFLYKRETLRKRINQNDFIVLQLITTTAMKVLKTIKTNDTISSYFIIALGLMVGAIAFTGFIIPAGIVGSGVTGIATIIYEIFDINVGYSVFAINALLLLTSLRVLGFSFGIKTIYGIVLVSLFLGLLQTIITEPLVKDRFMCAIIGGALAGVSVGIIISQGGSTGGTDILAMMINKYKNYSPGKLLLTIDVIIISSSYFISYDIEQVVYGFVTMGISAYCVDLILEGQKQSVQIFIFTKKPELLRKEIVEIHDQGLTVLNGVGGYSNEEVKVLMLLIRKKEAQNALRVIQLIDPDAFISMGSVMGVYGKGFDSIKH